MNELVIYEFDVGNTRAVAEAVGRGLGPDVPVVDVGRAPATLSAEVDLLVIGGPTHAFSMSRETTREDAVTKGAEPGHEGVGIREWLEGRPHPTTCEVATFDTRVAKVRKLPGSAAKAAAKSVKKHHLGRLVATESFYVDGMEGPLLDGELERAEAWGADLTARRGSRA